MMLDEKTARLHAAVLRSTTCLLWPGAGLLALASLHHQGWPLAAAALALLWQAWLGWRLQLDAALMSAVTGEDDLAALDATLGGLFGKPMPARPFAQRQQGMRRLLRRFLLATALGWALTLLALLLPTG